jgi:hypothetical protein
MILHLAIGDDEDLQYVPPPGVLETAPRRDGRVQEQRHAGQRLREGLADLADDELEQAEGRVEDEPDDEDDKNEEEDDGEGDDTLYSSLRANGFGDQIDAARKQRAALTASPNSQIAF